MLIATPRGLEPASAALQLVEPTPGYVRDGASPAVVAVGGFARMCVLSGKALFRRPFQWRELIEQG